MRRWARTLGQLLRTLGLRVYLLGAVGTAWGRLLFSGIGAALLDPVLPDSPALWRLYQAMEAAWQGHRDRHHCFRRGVCTRCARSRWSAGRFLLCPAWAPN